MDRVPFLKWARRNREGAGTEKLKGVTKMDGQNRTAHNWKRRYQQVERERFLNMFCVAGILVSLR
jgi:hypothetical protein